MNEITETFDQVADIITTIFEQQQWQWRDDNGELVNPTQEQVKSTLNNLVMRCKEGSKFASSGRIKVSRGYTGLLDVSIEVGILTVNV